MGLISLAMVWYPAFWLIAAALLTPPGSSESDGVLASGPSPVRLLFWLFLGVVCIALPVFVVVMARRAWLGWTLVLLALSGFVLGVILWMLGIL